jgi:hypothetical protein
MAKTTCRATSTGMSLGASMKQMPYAMPIAPPVKTKKSMCAVRPGVGLARSSRKPTPENVKNTASRNCNLARRGRASQGLLERAKEVKGIGEMIEDSFAEEQSKLSWLSGVLSALGGAVGGDPA